MKKTAFALQVFILLTILPVYVIVELNHTTTASTKSIVKPDMEKLNSNSIVLSTTLAE